MNKQFLSKVLHGDCFEWLPQIEDKSISLIATDPPYGINYKSNWSDKFNHIENDDNLNWIEKLFKELDRVSKDDSHLYCFTSLAYMDDFMREIKKYWYIRNLIIVPRTMKGGIGSLYYSFSPQNEYIIFATKGKRKFEETEILKPSETYLKDKRKKPKEWLYRLPDYWDWLKVSEHNLKRNHPTQKTVDVMETMLYLSSKESETVFDPFIGSGTTAVACIKTNRNFIGIEKDWDYCNIANERIKQAKEQKEHSVK